MAFPGDALRRLLASRTDAAALRVLVCAFVSSAALFAAPTAIGAAPAPTEQSLQRAELEELRRRIASLTESLDTVRTEHDRLQQSLGSLERSIGRITQRLRTLDGSLAEQQRRHEELIVRKRALDADLAVQREALARQVRAAYAMGRQEYLKMLLNQEDPALVGRILAYYDYLNRARAERMAAIAERVREVTEVATQIARTQQRLARTREEIARDRVALQATYEQRSALLARLGSDIRSKEQHLARYRGDAQRLEELLAGIQDAIEELPVAPDATQPFGALKGKLPWPVHGKMLARYGARRRQSGLRWQGVLIGAPEGGKVEAVSQGRVVFADWMRGFGLLMIIDHGEGYMSLYGHNQSLGKRAGDWVEAGEAVATVGASGGQTRPGLYFEIRHQGKPTDPARWCVVARNP